MLYIFKSFACETVMVGLAVVESVGGPVGF
jgi:hypothetical protein